MDNIVEQLNKDFLTYWYLRNAENRNNFNNIYFKGKQDAIVEILQLLTKGI